ncbi:uncharacterized protein LOC141910493 [Tubulanus polymorphus]|uniref:uncharacterized protein LOC141910493 n=1 Tax=Tubulanus polymorphus TaxID=672921 RepID=UPI003DA635AB
MEKMMKVLMLLCVLGSTANAGRYYNPYHRYMREPYEPVYARPCKKSDKVCVFTIEVKPVLTMVCNGVLVYTNNGTLLPYNVNPDDANATAIDPNCVVMQDGYREPHLVITANGTIPGPPIVAWENQEIIINVHNQLVAQATSIHWHGLHAKIWPWYDGVAWVNMCPIHPEQIYTHRLLAYPGGTMWYHSHVGVQISDGLYGPLIIKKHNDPLVADDFNVMLADVNHRHASTGWFLMVVLGIFDQIKERYDDHASTEFHSGLINGRGRFMDENGTFLTNGPLTEYCVRQGNYYRFRLFGSQADSYFIVSIDGHNMTVVTSDGQDLKHTLVTHVVVTPGERFDVLVLADQPIDNYWIRADNGGYQALAILRYNGSTPDVDPSSQAIECTSSSPCNIVNCDAPHFAPDQHFNCIPMKSPTSGHVPGTRKSRMREEFFNWSMQKGARVNGNKFRRPVSPILTQSTEPQEHRCTKPCKSGRACLCTYSMQLKLYQVVQMVFVSYGAGRGHHPIHTHGMHFHVLKVAQPKRNDTTGEIIGDNDDIVCDEDVFCNQPRWRNTTWGGNNIPGLNLHDPPFKDTINVPEGGYVVVRMKTKNSGVWPVHCHIEDHLGAGMMVLLEAAKPFWNLNNIPHDFPTCRHFTPRQTRPRDILDYYGYSTEAENDPFSSRIIYAKK